MFETSRDILNWAFTAAVVVLTFFIAWILFYIVKIFRQIQRLVSDITKAIEKFNHVLELAKEKISSAAAVLPLIVKAGEKAAEFVSSMREKNESPRSRKNKKDS